MSSILPSTIKLYNENKAITNDDIFKATMKPVRLLKYAPALLPILMSSQLITHSSLAKESPPTTATLRYDYDMDIFHPVVAPQAMVVSENKLASEIGLQILKDGGNAVDAAVAVGFALAVALPNAGNIGGGGFMIFHDAKTGKNIALDFRETAPASATHDMYLDKDGNVIPDKSWHTRSAVGIPGTVAGLTHALNKWGTMPLDKVMAPAIKLAKEGYSISPTLARQIKVERKHLQRDPKATEIFFRNGKPLEMGDKLTMPALAKSLELIAKDGPDAFYKGHIAQEIVKEMQNQEDKGLITAEDLANYKVIEREPLVGNYRGYKIVSMPPPSSGGIHILQMLNVLQHFPIREWGASSARTVRLMAETMKYAYADRSEFLGDPDFVDVPVQKILSSAYADKLARLVQDDDKVTPSASIKPLADEPYESNETTHFSIVDKDHNAVAVTYTLNLNFGSGIVAGDTGILLNNEMDDFSAKPGKPNAFGLIGGKANAIEPGKRALSSMSPTIVLKDGQTWMVTGSPGGSSIITTVLESLVNAIDFKMNPAKNNATPRFHHQWTPDELRLEKGFSPDTITLLKNLGYKVKVKPTMGKDQIIQMGPKGLWYGAADPRNPDGAAMGY